MRKFFLLTALATIATTSFVSAQDHEKDKPKIEGSGNVITREVSIQSFDELSVSGVFSVMLIQGNKEEVKIEADDNLQDLFEVKNEGSTLMIGMKKDINFNSKKKMKVYITFKKLKSMDLKTVGNVTSEQRLSFDNLKIGNKSVGSIDLQLTVQSLEIENKSVGNVKLQGKAENVTIKNNGVGSLHAADFVVQKMDIDNSGVGSAEVNAEKELKVKDSFLGKVTNKGAAAVKKKVVI
jgi:Putative auto-transporter adhesin, head GIN domain